MEVAAIFDLKNAVRKDEKNEKSRKSVIVETVRNTQTNKQILPQRSKLTELNFSRQYIVIIKTKNYQSSPIFHLKSKW